MRAQDIARITAALELLPIPVALVQVNNGKATIEAANKAFRVAGLWSITGPSPLVAAFGKRIRERTQTVLEFRFECVKAHRFIGSAHSDTFPAAMPRAAPPTEAADRWS